MVSATVVSNKTFKVLDNIHNTVYTFCDFTKAHIQGIMLNVVFNECNFFQADLTGAIFEHCTFYKCNLCSADFRKTTFTKVSVLRCNYTNWNTLNSKWVSVYTDSMRNDETNWKRTKKVGHTYDLSNY